VPPGRAGRLWLDRRLVAARRAADLLDRKLRILRAELSALQETAERTNRDWHQAAAEADRALLIAAVLGGQRAARLATGAGLASAEISFTTTMGISHPVDGTLSPPPGPDPWAGNPVHQARQAHRRALAAAVRHAAADRAVRVMEAEATATRYRLRAIRDRLTPRLEQARAQVVLAIDELERADAARLRQAEPSGPQAIRPSSKQGGSTKAAQW
jgi:V/A-type H+-transporting ATPase subunit D